jgi:adenine-specific DNA-methyltransferase
MSKSKIKDYRHDSKRKNNPPAGMVSYEKKVKEPEVKRYAYDPHLSPQLVWAGKPGLKTVEVEDKAGVEAETVSLHVHERVSTQAILNAVQNKPKQTDLFADPELPLHEAVKFYQHDVDWANRLILGDSLLVANSLIERELMAGKVQMIYMDPPYGVKYSSNFQARIDQRDVKDGDDHLTREPEMIKAYRDTWKLGIHSYLTYLKDRLRIFKELLSESGSIFVQIGEENVHIVRAVLDELFGVENYISQIAVKRPTMARILLRNNFFYLLWYAKNINQIRFNRLFFKRDQSDLPGFEKKSLGIEEYKSGLTRTISLEEKKTFIELENLGKIYQLDNLVAIGGSNETRFELIFRDKTFTPGNNGWKSDKKGMLRLIETNRVETRGDTLCYKNFLDDYPVVEIGNLWEDTSGPNKEVIYVVQTKDIIPLRCILMTTKPGDLVFDPTCGSGTTAFVSEQWGRRWITCDTSRVALSLARQRLLTATFPYYKIEDDSEGQNPRYGFKYKTVSHITLKSIAQNTRIDPEVEKYNPLIEAKLNELNEVLKKKPVREFDPKKGWQDWEVPFETGKTSC